MAAGPACTLYSVQCTLYSVQGLHRAHYQVVAHLLLLAGPMHELLYSWISVPDLCVGFACRICVSGFVCRIYMSDLCVVIKLITGSTPCSPPGTRSPPSCSSASSRSSLVLEMAQDFKTDPEFPKLRRDGPAGGQRGATGLALSG